MEIEMEMEIEMGKMWRGSRQGCRGRGAGILDGEIDIRQGQGY